MKNGLILAGIAFAVALAYIVGSRLSNEAMAVVVGAVCGISASIPVSIGLVIASSRSRDWGRNEPPREVGYDYGAHRFMPQPPVIIMSQPQQPMQSPYGFMPNQYMVPPSAPALGAPREFKIIGDE